MFRLKHIANILKKNQFSPMVISGFIKQNKNVSSYYGTDKQENTENKFNTVFSLPYVKYLSVFSRLKLYHFIASAGIIPAAGILEATALVPVPESVFLSTLCISVSTGALLTLFSLPLKDTIGFIYISDDNELIKISFLDFWGRRKDRVLGSDEWIPLSELPPRIFDGFFLSPVLTDGTKYKLFLKFGKVYSNEKMNCILE